uniref:Methyltransferase like 25 n=1 Tax=Sinocyclocheilus rhinocerous TaxID=307959 RepID=A0A673KQT1_9TELE
MSDLFINCELSTSKIHFLKYYFFKWLSLLRVAKAHCLQGLGVCMQLEDLMQNLRLMTGDTIAGESSDKVVAPDEFMNCKKAHEVQAMSEVVASLAKCCQVKQVIDVGSGKGYLCSYLSMRFNLQVFGINSSSTNTHGAQERNRKLNKFSNAYQNTPNKDESIQHSKNFENSDGIKNFITEEKESFEARADTSALSKQVTNDLSASNNAAECPLDLNDSDSGCSFLSRLSLDVIEDVSPRVHPSQLSLEEREKRKSENLERKAREGRRNIRDNSLFSPLTSYVTAETELKMLITELESRMFRAKQELRAVCSVGCCYHLLSEEFDQDRQRCVDCVCGFPMSQYLKAQACFCGRNARMSACLLPMESLFYRAVLHVILRDHYDCFESEKRVGKVYSKASSFVDYVRQALRKLDLDDTKVITKSSHITFNAFFSHKTTVMITIIVIILLNSTKYVLLIYNMTFMYKYCIK